MEPLQVNATTEGTGDQGARSPKPAGTKRLPFWKLFLFSTIPLAVLIFLGECSLRVFSLDTPHVRALPLPEQLYGLLQPDPELFWSLRPNLAAIYSGSPVHINSIGLRGDEVLPKHPGEFRILSLGESTTFGVGVSDSETYTAQLQTMLRREVSSRPIVALNAGVSAYSSFQSLKYLQSRGLNLKPDLVLFYHEVNDYLPSALRDSSNSEFGAMKTDEELYESNAHAIHRFLMEYSAIYRFAVYEIAYREIRSIRPVYADNPVDAIGLPQLNLAPRFRDAQRQDAPSNLPRESLLGRRVSDTERRANLEKLSSICDANNILLVVIHPSYRRSIRHECLLTGFCASAHVPMVEAYDVLHPPNVPHEALFLDSWHPTREGHLRLAEELTRAIRKIALRN